MKTIVKRLLVKWPANPTPELQVQQEIDTFVAALNSYPERFARTPYITFEQHLFSVVATNQYITQLKRD